MDSRGRLSPHEQFRGPHTFGCVAGGRCGHPDRQFLTGAFLERFLWWGTTGSVIYRKAYGARALEPRREAMTLDTVFDLASLTKVIVTTTAVMQLVERGKVRLNDPVAKYLPEFAQNGKEDITVRQLLDALLWAGAGSGFEDGVGREADGVPDGVCGDAAGCAGIEVFLQRH